MYEEPVAEKMAFNRVPFDAYVGAIHVYDRHLVIPSKLPSLSPPLFELLGLEMLSRHYPPKNTTPRPSRTKREKK